MTYPGAEHTRFAHSLGVFNFAQRIIKALRRRYADEKPIVNLLDQTTPALKAAALLHDIGHGPFSHLMERAGAFPEMAKHQVQSIRLIRETGSIPQRLADHKIDVEDVANIVRETSEHRFLDDIVSSQLDADRMDYILLDSLSIGVEYGSFDSQWVLNSLCLGLEPTPDTRTGPEALRLCLEEKRGVPSAEQLVMARMHMTFQVYCHRVTRGWEAHLLCALKLASQLAKEDKLPPTTPSNVLQFLVSEKPPAGDGWLWFDESAKEAALHSWAEASGEARELAELSRAFLLREKLFLCAPLKHVTTEKSVALGRGLDRIGRDRIDWWLDDPKFTSYKDYSSSFSSPSKDDGAVSTGAILISEGATDARARPAEVVSGVLDGLGKEGRGTRESLCRLYFHRRLEEPVRKLLAELGLNDH